MKRALLVTTGTVVGVASVLAYKPNPGALSNIPGVQALGATQALAPAGANATPAAATSPASTPAAAPSTQAATPAATPTRKAAKHKTKKKRATATHKATAKPTATRTAAASAPKPTATATQKSTPTPTPTQAASGFKDGSFTSGSQQVISHGGYYGDLTANVTVSGGRITAVNLSETGGGRNDMFAQAVQQYLVPEIIKTQNPRVGIVSGATGTSMALINALASVLQKA